MTVPTTRDVLNRLLAIEYRSLPIYLMDGSPWVPRGAVPAAETLRLMVADQQAMAGRIAEQVLERYERVDYGKFPMWFTGVNDCSLEYLIGVIIEELKKDIVSIERCVADLQYDLPARSLAEETLGLARGHLESLEELTRPGTAVAGAPA